jgi:Flp pilus assembly protein TadG
MNTRQLLDNQRGVTAIEFSLIAPVLLAIVLGFFKFGIGMQQFMNVTNAATQGAMTLALARGGTTPYTSTTAAVTSAAPNLTASSITTTVTIGGSACTSDSTCNTKLTSGATASVKVSYPCSLTVMGVNYAPSGCNLVAQSAQMVQ